MGTAVGELAGVVFLVGFYIWLIIVLVTPICQWIARAFARLNSSLSDDAVRDRVAEKPLGKVFLTALWPFGDLQLPAVTAAERDATVDAASFARARLRMDENRRVCEWKIASIRATEQKAIAQVTAAAIILAVLSAFGRDDLSFVFKAIPIAALIVAIAAYLKTAYIHMTSPPSVISEPLDEAWHDYGFKLDAVSKIKVRYVKTGNFWFIAALLMILLLAILPAAPNASNRGVCCPAVPTPRIPGV